MSWRDSMRPVRVYGFDSRLRGAQTLDVFIEGIAAFRVEVLGMCIHPSDGALAVLDRELCLAAGFADHGFAHEPVVDFGILGSELLAHGVGLIEAAFIDELDDAVGEPVELGLCKVVSVRRCRWRGLDVSGPVAIPAAALVLLAAATRARLISADLRHGCLVVRTNLPWMPSVRPRLGWSPLPRGASTQGRQQP